MTLLRQQKQELLSAKYRMATAVGVLGYTAPAVPVPWGAPHSAAKPDAVQARGLYPTFYTKVFFPLIIFIQVPPSPLRIFPHW